MFRKFLPILLLVCLGACGHLGTQTTLTVFAAASLSEAFSDIATIFEATHPRVEVMLNLVGSNTLRA